MEHYIIPSCKQAKASIPCAVKNDVSKDNTPIQKNDTAIFTETFDLHQVKLYQNIGATYHNGQQKSLDELLIIATQLLLRVSYFTIE